MHLTCRVLFGGKKGGLVVLLNGISSNVNGTRMMVTLNDVVTTFVVGDCSNPSSSGRKL